jgi:predicted ATPase
MSEADIEDVSSHNRRVHKLVLTGGPCSGKTTGQARLSTFFENMGWKVYRVPETATHLLSGGVEFSHMDPDQVEEFQEDLLLCMIQTEETFFRLAKRCDQNCLVICDRGTMDARAYMSEDSWDRVLKRNALNAVELRDNRYDQVVHLVTAANGAEDFYNTEDNPMRKEGLELARQRDQATGEAWIGHPYLEIIDNSTDFDTKLKRLIMAVCLKVDIDVGDRLAERSKKVKFLVAKMPSDMMFPSYQDFHVVHEYLISANPNIQLRLRMRGQGNTYSYQYTIRQVRANNQVVELRRQISHRDYLNLLAQRDHSHYTVHKKRRCFLWRNLYFQLDMYLPPCSPKCEGLILLETYTTLKSSAVKLPPFLEVIKDATGDPEFSMFNLSRSHPSASTLMAYGGFQFTELNVNNNKNSNNSANNSNGNIKNNGSMTITPQ